MFLLILSVVGCIDCTPELWCFVEKSHSKGCVNTEDANALGGCGSSGYYEQNGQHIFFETTVCDFSSSSVQKSTFDTTSSAQSPSKDKSSTTQPNTTPNNNQEESYDETDSSGLSDGAIAGIVVGSVAALLGIAFSITFFLGGKQCNNFLSKSKGSKIAYSTF